MAGAGWWTSPNIMYFVAPDGTLAADLPLAFAVAARLAAVPFAVLGALPWIWNDVNYGFNSLETQDARGTFLDHLGYFFTHALPAGLGIRAPFTGSWIIGTAHLFLYAIVLGLLGLAVWLGLRERSLASIALLTLPFLFALNPVASNLDSDFIGNGRYFYFFAPILALVVARLARPIAPAARARGGARDLHGVGLRADRRLPRRHRRRAAARPRHRNAGT